MEIIMHETGKWFHDYQDNFLSNGEFILLKKYNCKLNSEVFTSQIKLMHANSSHNLYEELSQSKDILSGLICLSKKQFAIFRFIDSNGNHIFSSTETDKKIIKKFDTSIIPWEDRLIIIEHKGNCFSYINSNYECYDSKFNLIWRYAQNGFINDSAYQIFDNFIEIGTDTKLYFNKKGQINEKPIKESPQNLIEQSDWYQNGEWYTFLTQIGERCISIKAISKSLLNGHEYVLHCQSSSNKFYIAKFDKNLKLIWKCDLPYCSNIMQLFYVNGIYYSIGNKTEDSFCITAINEKGEILEESNNILSNEFCGYIVNGKLVIFYNRIDNLNDSERKLLNDGLTIANGYYLFIN